MKTNGLKQLLWSFVLGNLILINTSYAENTISADGAIVHHIKKVVKKNENWKQALVTGQDAQVVMMTINTKTNPKNEIGLETHAFDQVIYIMQGKAKAIINDKPFLVKKGDLVFVPKGSAHNFINLNPIKSLKILSIYSKTDMPAGKTYSTQSQMLKEEKQ